MEHGTARINRGIGEIDTEANPTPVGFKKSAFDRIHDGDEVVFWRSASDPHWAFRVVVASSMEQLVRMATPAGGLTRGAATLVHDAAARLVAQAERAPTDEQVNDHLVFAQHAMERVAAMGNARPGPLNAQQVRSMLK